MKRNYGIDLLRCVSMLMVVVLHILGHGGLLKAAPVGSAVYNTVWLLETACYCAVNCYALISGYVGVKSRFRYSGIVQIWLQVLFYTVSIAAVLYFLVPGAVGKNEMLKSVFPFTHRTYWYFSAYAAAFFLFPVLANGINNLTEKQAKVTVVAIIAVFTVIKVALSVDIFESIPVKDLFNLSGGYSVIWLLLLYVVGGCIGKYDLLKKIPSALLAIAYILCVAASWGAKILIQKFEIDMSSDVLIDYASPTIVICGISLVELFSRFRFSEGAARFIGFCAPCAFGVYLFHENPLFRNNFITDKFVFLSGLNPALIILSVIGIALVIFTVCLLTDRLRLLLFKALKIKELTSKIDR